MKKQAVNPFLPISEYIPDGEAHVFGNRVYLYGSHDQEGGNTFCMLPYQVWSAPVDDLSDWSTQGISYEAKQDPLYSPTRPYMFAPDCVQGNDGRFYLYYCLAGEKGKHGYDGPISVAVCDTPDGKFSYYGVVRHPNQTPFNDVVVFDPAVFNDSGTIRLYFGACFPFDNYGPLSQPILKRLQSKMFSRSPDEIKRGVMGAYTLTLASDMLTLSSEPIRLFPTRTRKTDFASHPFFEGSSIRKVGKLYYFVYSSQKNHELCYATSVFPDHDFKFQGVLVSNGDVGYQGRKAKDRVNHTGTNHGCIEQIQGRFYVFYHRQTHGSDFSRQACAEPIFIKANGCIDQVPMTSCGLNGGPLQGLGIYPSTICCHLSRGHMPHGGFHTLKQIPMVTHQGEERFIGGLRRGTKVVYRSFDTTHTQSLDVRIRGKGKIQVLFGATDLGTFLVNNPQWCTVNIPVTDHSIDLSLTFIISSGNQDILSLEFR